jgi:hypothetical protein
MDIMCVNDTGSRALVTGVEGATWSTSSAHHAIRVTSKEGRRVQPFASVVCDVRACWYADERKRAVAARIAGRSRFERCQRV